MLSAGIAPPGTRGAMWFIIRALLVVSAAACVLGGCTTTRKYRMVDEPSTCALELNVVAANPELEIRLASVTVYQGPGSWKQDALWDEYSISLRSRGSRVITVESLALVDILGESKLPGTDPWELERLSEANWERYARVGRFVWVSVLQGPCRRQLWAWVLPEERPQGFSMSCRSCF